MTESVSLCNIPGAQLTPADLDRVGRRWSRARNEPLRIPLAEQPTAARGEGWKRPPLGAWAEALDRLLIDPREKLLLADRLNHEPLAGLDRLGARSPATRELPELPELDRPFWLGTAERTSRQQTNYPSREEGSELGRAAEIVANKLLADREARSESRRKRHRLRDVLKRESTSPRLQKCGCLVLSGRDVGITRRGPEGSASFTGLASCSLVWSCPVCSARIARGRQGMVEQLLDRHFRAGGTALFLTLTLRHSRADDLKQLRRTAGKCFTALWSGRGAQELAARYGLVGHVRSMELTHGGNGWHPHIHAHLLFRGELTAAEATDLRSELVARWISAVVRTKAPAPLPEAQHGEMIRTAEEAAQYITKHGAAAELTGFTGKEGREGGRAPFQILNDYRLHGRRADLALWRTYERGMKGARFLTWSRGLQRLYAITEKTDEQLAEAAEREASSRPALVMSPELWKSTGAYPHFRERLLDTIEREGVCSAVELLVSLPHVLDGSLVLAVYSDEPGALAFSGAGGILSGVRIHTD